MNHSRMGTGRRTAYGVMSCAIAFALLTPARLGGQETVVTFQGLGDLAGGDNDSVARAVSADGTTVVGRGSTDTSRQAFRWTAADGMRGLGVLAEEFGDSEAWAVSADGSVVVGQASSLTLEFGEAFRWTQSTGMNGLGAPADARGSAGYGVSGNGSVIVGGFNGEMGPEAFQWTAGGGFVRLHPFTGRDALSTAIAIATDGATVGGLGRTPTTYPNTQAFLWAAGTGAELGGLTTSDVWSAVNALSADGSVAVGWSISAAGTQAFRWDVDLGMAGLGDLPGGSFLSIANACSADGATVVGAGSSDVGQEGFVWTNASGMVSVTQFLAGYGISAEGWVLSEAVGISADGSVIVGNGMNPNGEFEPWMVTVRTTPPPDPDPDPNPDPNPVPKCKRKHHHHPCKPPPSCQGEKHGWAWWSWWWSHKSDNRWHQGKKHSHHSLPTSGKKRR